MNKMSKVSVVTVCYNAEKYIEETILSVINQTYKNIEYIIIDGASTDNTINIVNKYRDQIAFFVSEPDKGIYDAMNKGINIATGEWINFMNAGDTFYSNNAVSDIISKVDDSSTIAYGDTVLVYELGERLKTPDPLCRLEKEMVFGHQSTFIKSDYHKEHLFDISFRSSGDYKFFREAYFEGKKFQYIPVIVAKYLAQGGISNTQWVLVAKENARIYGIDKSFKWKIKFLIIVIRGFVLEALRKILPSKMLKQIRQRNLNKVGSCIESKEN